MLGLSKNTKAYSQVAVIFLAVFLLSGCDYKSADNPIDLQKLIEQQKIIPVQPKKELYKVVKVVDGDTMDVDMKGKTERLRLIGMDTPETSDPRKVVQCFAREASTKAKEILEGKMVSLEADSTQGERDKYGRLLRYVYLEDGTFYNKQMISDGYAHEYTYQSNPYKYQEEFKQAEKEARENERGLWNKCTCNGDTNKPENEIGSECPSCGDNICNNQETSLSCPSDCPVPLPCDADCSANKYNCPDFKTQKEAQEVYNCCMQKVGSDIHKLDRDNDKIACENNK